MVIVYHAKCEYRHSHIYVVTRIFDHNAVEAHCYMIYHIGLCQLKKGLHSRNVLVYLTFCCVSTQEIYPFATYI